VLQGVLVGETLEMLFQLPRHFGWATGARAVDEALRTFMGKAMHPFAEGGIGKREGVGDRL
jgi:hypothetical protein